MALVNADRVKETSATTGTGTYSLDGAMTGFRTFVAGVGNANTCYYAATDGTNWEVGLGTVTDATPDTLSRDSILASSNGGAAVNWGAGTKTVWCDLPAAALWTAVGAGLTDFMVLSASGGYPTTTNGCGGPTQVETTTNKNNYWALEFDTATEENAFWPILLPKNYDGGTFTAQLYWTNASGLTTETVVFGIKGIAYADDAALDAAFGTEVTQSDTWIAQNDVHVSSVTSAITFAGTPTAGKAAIVNVARKVASDNLTGDARLLMVFLFYTVSKLGQA